MGSIDKWIMKIPEGFMPRGKYKAELEELCEFMESTKLTMRFTFGSSREADNARKSIARYTQGMPIILMQREKYVWVIKIKEVVAQDNN